MIPYTAHGLWRQMQGNGNVQNNSKAKYNKGKGETQTNKDTAKARAHYRLDMATLSGINAVQSQDERKMTHSSKRTRVRETYHKRCQQGFDAKDREIDRVAETNGNTDQNNQQQ